MAVEVLLFAVLVLAKKPHNAKVERGISTALRKCGKFFEKRKYYEIPKTIQNYQVLGILPRKQKNPPATIKLNMGFLYGYVYSLKSEFAVLVFLRCFGFCCRFGYLRVIKKLITMGRASKGRCILSSFLHKNQPDTAHAAHITIGGFKIQGDKVVHILSY